MRQADGQDDRAGYEPDERLDPRPPRWRDQPLPLIVTCPDVGEDSGDDVEERRLARAVGSDQAVDHAALDRHVDALDGDQAAESFRHFVRDEDVYWCRRSVRRSIWMHFRWPSVGLEVGGGLDVGRCLARRLHLLVSRRTRCAARVGGGAREEALRSEQHEQHEQQAVEQELVLEKSIEDRIGMLSGCRKLVSCGRNTCCRMKMMNAPAATPQMLPMPPRTTMARTVNETVNRNWVGATNTACRREDAGEACR